MTKGTKVGANAEEVKAASDAAKGTFFTRMPAGLFRYELLPYIAHPKDLLVLMCTDR